MTSPGLDNLGRTSRTRVRAPRGRAVMGFTLIELLLVVVIIGLLAAIALPRFRSARDKAHRAQMQTDLRNLVSAEESYFEQYSIYTGDISLLEFNTSQGVSITIGDVSAAGWNAKATHGSTSSVCGIYLGGATAPSGVALTGDGIVGCN